MEISGLKKQNNCNERFIRGTQQQLCSRKPMWGLINIDNAVRRTGKRKKKQLQRNMEHQHICHGSATKRGETSEQKSLLETVPKNLKFDEKH